MAYKFDMSSVPAVTVESVRLGELSARAFERGLDVTGKTADEIEEMLTPGWAEDIIDDEPVEVEVVTCRSVWAEITGVELSNEDEAAELLADAVEIMPLSPLKEKARSAVDTYLAWSTIVIEQDEDEMVFVEPVEENVIDGRIERWELVERCTSNNPDYAAPEQFVSCIHGYIYDSDRFDDGDEVYTSPVVPSIADELRIETQSGSIYELGEPRDAKPDPADEPAFDEDEYLEYHHRQQMASVEASARHEAKMYQGVNSAFTAIVADQIDEYLPAMTNEILRQVCWEAKLKKWGTKSEMIERLRANREQIVAQLNREAGLVEEDTVSEFPTSVEINKMTVKELDAALRELDVPGRSKATTKTAKQLLLSQFRNEEEKDEQGVYCHRCGELFIPDEADYNKFLGSGKPFDPTDWVCLDCKVEEVAIWELQQREAEAIRDAQVAEEDREREAREVEMGDLTPLERLACEWWTPAAVADRLGTLVDPAGNKPYVHAPPLCAFVFKLGEIMQSMNTFNPARWVGTKWQVRLAVVEERTGKPDLSLFS